MAVRSTTGCGGFWSWLCCRRAPENEEVFRWRSEDRTISLIKRGDELVYRIAVVCQNIIEGAIPTHGNRIDDLIESLIEEWEPVMTANSALHFLPKTDPACPLYTLREWNWNGKKVSLMRDKEKLCHYWRLVDMTLKTASEWRFEHVLLKKRGFQISSPSRMGWDDYELAAHAKDFLIEEASLDNDRLTSITIKPSVRVRSFLDPNVILDNFSWAVSLINSVHDEYGHAQLVIETAIGNTTQMFVAHLQGPKLIGTHDGIVKLNEIDPDRLRAVQGTTWSVTRKDAENMLEQIRLEQEKRPVERSLFGLKWVTLEPSVAFNALGHDSILSPKLKETAHGFVPVHNCMTWAREKLEIAGVRMEKEQGRLLTTPKEYLSPSPGQCPRFRSLGPLEDRFDPIDMKVFDSA